jgi:CRP-like cAMP-binding protein
MTTQSPRAKAVVRSSLAQKLAQFVTLSPAEAEVLEDLQSTIRMVRHSREIISQGRRYDGLLMMVEGVAVRYRILRDGRRQVLNIALPGT